MIQVSTPIQAQNSSGSQPDSTPVESPGSLKSRKKDKLGVFAKLLEGLIGKSRNRGAGKNNFTAINETGEAKPSSDLKKTGKTVKKGETNSPKGEETLGIWNLLGQEEAITGQDSVIKPEFDLKSADFVLKGPESQSARAEETGEAPSPSPQGVFSGLDVIPPETQAREGEFSLTGDGIKAGSGTTVEGGTKAESGTKADDSSLSATPREEEAKSGGKAVVDMLPASARNQGEKLFQFDGSPRPGLVDTFSGGESAGESRGGRLLEGRKRGRSEERDLKTGEVREAGASETVKSLSLGAGAEKADVEIRVELSPEPGFKGREGDSGKAGGFLNQGLEDALAGELRENLNADIVKQASILVRNQQEGTIRLTLKPETLGNIKIRLEMAENKITGHIIVESQEALKAFERELPVLEKAFRDSGFSETNLDMSMAGNGETYGQEGGDFNNFSPALAASLYDAGIVERELVPGGFFPENSGTKAVNMLV